MKTPATHYIECFENAGNGLKRRIYQPCTVIGQSKDGSQLIVEPTVRIRNSKKGKPKRYVDRNRLIPMYVETGKHQNHHG